MSLHSRGPLSENIALDDHADVATVYGIKIHGDLLRILGEPTPPGQWFRIIGVDDGVATVQTRFGVIEALEDFCRAFENLDETTSLAVWNARMRTAYENAREVLAGRMPYADPQPSDQGAVNEL